jgi:hypothetical protein
MTSKLITVGSTTLTYALIINFGVAVGFHVFLLGLFASHGDRALAGAFAWNIIPSFLILALATVTAIALWKEKPLANVMATVSALLTLALYYYDVTIGGPDATFFGPNAPPDWYLNWFWL